MSNDNMELTTRLQSDQHSCQELAGKLAVQEDELTQLHAQLVDRDRSVEQLQRTLTSLQREEFQQDQIQDRLRHYEAQAQLVETLQNELHSAQDMMDALTTQNKELRIMLIKVTAVSENSESTDAERETSRDEVIESLSTRIQHLETERSQLSENLRDQRQLSDNLGIKVADLQEEVIRKSASNEYLDSDKISRAEFEKLRSAMEMIQEKYMSVMRDKAELSDKAEQLEHLVLQLQGETDTIGEYISLYHHQRALLQQRELQKNDYIVQLAKDREEMQGKLGQLQGLVMQLLGEKNMLHSYHEEAHHSPPSASPIQPHMAALQGATHHHPHHHPHHHHHHHGQQNGREPEANEDWPDYTSSESESSEVEQIIGGEEFPDSPTPTRASPTHSMSDSASYMAPPTSESVQPDTAHRILNLLSEIGTSNLVDRIPILERNFHPCKFCSGKLQIV